MTTLNTLTKESIGKLTLKQADEALQERQKELDSVFKEAADGNGGYDFNKVTCLGDGVKGSSAVAALVAGANNEMNELGEHRDTLIAAEKAAQMHEKRSKAQRNVPLPGGFEGKGNYGDEGERFKALGEMVTQHKSYQDWSAAGSSGSVKMQFDMLGSDFIAASSGFATIGQKALMSLSAGYASRPVRLPGFVEAVTRPIQMLDIIPMFETSKDSVPYMEETTRTHAAAGTAEGGAYAESTFIFTERTSPVRKITDSVPVTDEQLDDEPFIAGYINGRLVFGIRQKFDEMALIGNGTAPNLRGLKNTAGIQTQAKGADPVPDTFYKAMTKVRTTGRAIPTHHIMHPTDWQNVRLLRTVDGVYIWGNPSEAGPERMWGLPVVQNDADVAGTGYTGSFMPEHLSGFERKGVDVEVGLVGTQFLEGKRTIRGDMRAALIFFRPVAFCQNTGL